MSLIHDGGQTAISQPVIFHTTTSYPLPPSKFMIPTSFKRYQLSQLVNKALGLDKTKPVPFDFLIRGGTQGREEQSLGKEVLTGSVGDWCRENGVGEEEVLEIEYIESVMPPQKMSDFPHEDWVSDVVCDVPGHFLTSSYDGHIRSFDFSKTVLLDYTAHGAPITSLSVLPFTNQNENGNETYTVFTASQDLTAKIHQITLSHDLSISVSDSTRRSQSRTLASLHLHTSTVSSVSSNAAGTHLITSSWDGLIGVWDTSIPETDEVPEPALNERDSEGKRKRRKVQQGGEEGVGTAEGKVKRKAPLNVLKSHIGRVSKAIWGDREAGGEERKVYSCGFDSTMRVWDTEYGVCEHTINASEKPFLDITLVSSLSSLLSISSDRTMSLYDIRTSTSSSSNPLSSIAQATFTHPANAMPSCLSTSSTNAHQVVTGAYDGIVRVWDLRSTKGAMASFRAFQGNDKNQAKAKGGKVLSVHWKRGLVGIGGEGGLEVWKVGEEKAV